MDLTVIQTPEGPVVRVAGDVQSAEAVELDRQVRDLLDRHAPVAVELGDLGALSAPGLAVLVDLQECSRSSGTELRFVGLRRAVSRLIDAVTDWPERGEQRTAPPTGSGPVARPTPN